MPTSDSGHFLFSNLMLANLITLLLMESHSH